MIDIHSQILIVFLIGIAVAINPCILAANISALTYMIGNEGDKNRKYLISILYLLGRIIAFTVLGITIGIFADYLNFDELFSKYLGKALGPVFVIVGFILLFLKHIHSHTEESASNLEKQSTHNKYLISIVGGFLVAFALCPEGAAIYFSSMIPILFHCNFNQSVIISIVFALGSIIPPIVISLLLISGSKILSGFKEKHGEIEVILRKVIAALFIIAGLMFIVEYYFE